MFDYYRISVTGFFVIAILLCAVAPLCLFWEPMVRVGLFSLLGPYVAAVIWLAVLVMALRVHRRRGLWLLATAFIIVPATYLHAMLFVGCALTGNCP